MTKFVLGLKGAESSLRMPLKCCSILTMVYDISVCAMFSSTEVSQAFQSLGEWYRYLRPMHVRGPPLNGT